MQCKAAGHVAHLNSRHPGHPAFTKAGTMTFIDGSLFAGNIPAANGLAPGRRAGRRGLMQAA